MRTPQSMHSLTHTHTQQQKTYPFWAPCTSLRSPNSHHQPWTHLWKKERSTFTKGIKRECSWPVYINTMESLLQKVLNKPTPPAQRSTPPQKSNAIESLLLSVQILPFHGYNSLTFLTMITSGVDDWVKNTSLLTSLVNTLQVTDIYIFMCLWSQYQIKPRCPPPPSLFQNCPWKSSLMVLMTCTSIDTHLKTIQLLFKKINDRSRVLDGLPASVP